MDRAIDSESIFVFKTSHRIVYNTTKPVPIRDVIQALQGLDGLLKPVPQLVAQLTGIEILRGEFHIQSLESGSLIEDVVVSFFFKNRENLDAFVAKAGGSKVVKATVITVAIAAVTAYGMHLATSGKTVPNITANNNIIFNIGAGEVGLTPEAFTAIVRSAVGDKKAVAESALKFIGPARADPGSNVTVGDETAGKATGVPIVISADAIREAPVRVNLEPNERIEEFKSAQLIIRATDLDSKKKGWAGKLSPREDRLPIELDPSVSESEIFGRSTITVDAALVFKEKGKSKELKPARIYVRRVVK